MRNRIIGIAVLVIVLVIGFYAFRNYTAQDAHASTLSATPVHAKTSNRVSAEGTVLPAQRTTLAFKIGGRRSRSKLAGALSRFLGMKATR